ncbi:MAG TPA: response regulator [Bacteroidota bacterium]|nr:response regulator [Bacteroidota bacterium]
MEHHLKMLCVDDNEQLRNNLRDQFLMEEFDVDTASDGAMALEKIRTTDYDLVLLDLKMPKMDGKQVLTKMKEINRSPRVIMLTAVDDVATAMECVKLGAKDYISKPYDPEELLHIVIKVLGT